MISFEVVLIVIALISGTVSFIMTGAIRGFHRTKPVKQFTRSRGEYIRLLDNTLLLVEDGGEKDPYIIAANKEVEAICSR